RTRSWSAEPIGCGRTAICSTWRIARSAEKTVSDAVAGTGDGGRETRRIDSATSAISPTAVARRRSMLVACWSLRLSDDAPFYKHVRKDSTSGRRPRNDPADDHPHARGGRLRSAHGEERRRSPGPPGARSERNRHRALRRHHAGDGRHRSV